MNTSVWDAKIPEHEPFEIEVTVRDMRPGLTSEESLIGTRIMNSQANKFHLLTVNVVSGQKCRMVKKMSGSIISVLP
jgi:hypothetical protein